MPNRSLPGRAASAPDASTRPPPIRVGDHLALDFLNSTAAPRGAAIEWIGTGPDLLHWLVGAGALDLNVAERIAADWSPGDLGRVAEEAVELREWFRGVVAHAKACGSDALAIKDVERLNGVLARDAAFQRVEPAGEDGRLRLVADRPWRDPGELLAPVAAAMAHLVCEGDFNFVHQCENPPCTLWFYDRTKSHRRRWCSPAVCGNRAKVAAHRARVKLARPGI